MALAEVGIQVRALDAQKAKSDIAAVRSEVAGLDAANNGLTQSTGQVTRATDAASRANKGDKATVDALTASVRQQAAVQTAVVTPLNRGAGAMKNFGQVANQISFQVQDFFVQMASGQSLFMAFAQQAPQAAGAFTMLGGRLGNVIPYVGTLIAIGAAVAPMFLNIGASVKSADDAFDDAQSSLDAYRASLDAANLSHEEMIDKYGRLAGAARLALGAMSEIARLDAISAVRAQVDAVAAGIQDTFNMVGIRSGAYVRDLLADLGLTADQMVQVIDLADQLQAATTLEDQGRIASEFSRELLDIYGTVEAMPDAILEWYRGLSRTVTIAGETKTAIDDAETSVWDLVDAASNIAGRFLDADVAAQGFLGTVTAAASKMWELSQARVKSEGLLDDAGNPTNMLAGNRGRSRPERRSFEASENAIYGYIDPAARRAAKAAASEAEREADRIRKSRESAVKSIYEQTRTPAEAYANTVAELNDLRKEGWFTNDVGGIETFNRAMAEAKKELDEVSKDTLGVSSAFSSMLDGMMNDADNAADHLVNFVASVLNNVASKIMQPSVDVLGNAASSFISGFLPGMGGARVTSAAPTTSIRPGPRPSFSGGGWTGNGSRTGGLDGEGGYMAIIHPREIIHDTTKGAVPGFGGQQSVHVTVGVDQKTGNLRPFVRQEAGGMDAQWARVQSRAMPSMQADNHRRGIS